MLQTEILLEAPTDLLYHNSMSVRAHTSETVYPVKLILLSCKVMYASMLERSLIEHNAHILHIARSAIVYTYAATDTEHMCHTVNLSSSEVSCENMFLLLKRFDDRTS